MNVAQKNTTRRDQMKVLRKKLNLSQHDLAMKIGCTETHIRFIERGINDPSSRMANAICHALKSDVYTVFPDIFKKNS
ncbi:hypothetical protein J2TS6_48500 [Paenibacillus albilobatus]|uniref:HTH cro/C1-type domain-containing protein n=1 Tax=Paenibacillus albilobatus TaxID=2716884 RepID=A0A919XJ82_9BACL|nr:helix-turn-helix transcriptional regulator [Paenibacillus albilobatus]GIO33709.1 hypothetical protein J2TS6_48500 [Paenibacillus albilobatus]